MDHRYYHYSGMSIVNENAALYSFVRVDFAFVSAVVMRLECVVSFQRCLAG